MKFVCDAPFPALYFKHRNARGEPRWVVIMRATFGIGAAGALERLDPQPKVNFAERSFDDDLAAPIQRESDLAPEKPRRDLIVNAHAHAPGGNPAPRFEACSSFPCQSPSQTAARGEETCSAIGAWSSPVRASGRRPLRPSRGASARRPSWPAST